MLNVDHRLPEVAMQGAKKDEVCLSIHAHITLFVR